MGVKPLPLSLLLVQLGACADAQRWGRGRSLTATTLRACPSREWRAWLAKKLGVSTRAAWQAWRAAALRALGSGYGYGSGYGSGDGVRITRTYQAA